MLIMKFVNLFWSYILLPNYEFIQAEGRSLAHRRRDGIPLSLVDN